MVLLLDKALSMGADMINDISGGDFDPTIFDIVAKYKCSYVLMHHKGTPSDMQDLYIKICYIRSNGLFHKKLASSTKKGFMILYLIWDMVLGKL